MVRLQGIQDVILRDDCKISWEGKHAILTPLSPKRKCFIQILNGENVSSKEFERIDLNAY